MAQATNVPNGYDSTDRKAYNNQEDVMNGWESMKWADHNWFRADSHNLPRDVRNATSAVGASRVSELYSSENFRAYQFDNGAGVVMHYDTREAIRLPDGTVYQNDQCFATGFARCTHPSEYAARLPFSAIERLLNNTGTLFDIKTVIGQPTEREHSHSDGTYTTHYARNTAVKIDGADATYWILIGRDPSIRNGPSKFVFRHEDSSQTGTIIQTLGVEKFINQLLTPEAVQESSRTVVSADEYTKTRLDENERIKHVQAGGNLSESESRWRDERINRQHFRADMQGKVIVRHGEWFFIPRPHASPRDNGRDFAESELDNHTVARSGVPRSPLPRACDDCGSVPLAMSDDGVVTCGSCGNVVERQIFVNGEIRHADGDHDAVNLGDTWHEAVSHDKDVLIYDDRPTENSRGRRGRRGSGMRWD